MQNSYINNSVSTVSYFRNDKSIMQRQLETIKSDQTRYIKPPLIRKTSKRVCGGQFCYFTFKDPDILNIGTDGPQNLLNRIIEARYAMDVKEL